MVFWPFYDSIKVIKTPYIDIISLLLTSIDNYMRKKDTKNEQKSMEKWPIFAFFKKYTYLDNILCYFFYYYTYIMNTFNYKVLKITKLLWLGGGRREKKAIYAFPWHPHLKVMGKWRRCIIATMYGIQVI